MFGRVNAGSPVERKPIIATTAHITLRVNEIYCIYGAQEYEKSIIFCISLIGSFVLGSL